ncbi:DUF6221 family protein [Streptomyces sp. NPDC093509]|uniref:DUF6221 family protein n=1 Tax=Streptomyces sp. NPDC093509 TaxID=3154982 RepID=UPI00344CD483
MTSLHDLPPEQQMDLVRFARARLAEERAQRLREIELKKKLLDDAESAIREQAPRDNWHSVSLGMPIYLAHLVAKPYDAHPDYDTEWDRD